MEDRPPLGVNLAQVERQEPGVPGALRGIEGKLCGQSLGHGGAAGIHGVVSVETHRNNVFTEEASASTTPPPDIVYIEFCRFIKYLKIY